MNRKRHFYLVTLVLLSSLGIAQNATIKAKKTNWKISVTSTDTVLWVEKENPLVINIEGGNNFLVDIQDAKWRNFGNKYLVEVFTEGATTLTIYEKLPGKKMKALYTKLYEVRRVPEPVPYVCGVKADSVIDRLQLIKVDVITAISPFDKLQVPVVGFDVIFSFSGVSDTLTSADSHFTLGMKRRIYYLVPGSILYFENMYCVMPDGRIKKLKPFEIYVDETNKYKVGYRLFSGNN